MRKDLPALLQRPRRPRSKIWVGDDQHAGVYFLATANMPLFATVPVPAATVSDRPRRILGLNFVDAARCPSRQRPPRSRASSSGSMAVPRITKRSIRNRTPKEYRGEFGTVQTKVPGLYYSEHLKRLAAIADKTTIIRSIRHDQGNHGAGNHYMMTGAPPRIPVGCGAFVSFHPSLGSVVAAEKGAPSGLPAYFSIPEMSRSGGPNFLGASTPVRRLR
jgi:hypothetical protein